VTRDATRSLTLVAHDVVKTGGMDRANYALAAYALDQGWRLTLVSNRVGPGLMDRPNLTVRPVWKPAGREMLGQLTLHPVGRRWAAVETAQGGRVVVNGGNCLWGDVNWVHYLHRAFFPQVHGLRRRLFRGLVHRWFLTEEWASLRRARLVVANSETTRRSILEKLQLAPEKVHTLYYGSSPDLFHPPSEAERAAARERLELGEDQPTALYLGALGDYRKGFDVLFEAWKRLAAEAPDAVLLAVGAGADLPRWQGLADDAGLTRSLRFLGFRDDVPQVLAACDLLVHPARYEAYGLGVHEALCSGVPALVSRSAGVAERYPAELSDWLLDDPEDPVALHASLQRWLSDPSSWRRRCLPLSSDLSRSTWDHMAADFLRLVEKS